MVAGKPVVSPTLVGRHDELAALVAVVTDVPAVVCVEGEAGVGKTRLVSELLGRPEVAGREVLYRRQRPASQRSLTPACPTAAAAAGNPANGPGATGP